MGVLVTLFLSLIDMRCGCWTSGIHSWWLLNSDISKVPSGTGWGETTENPFAQRPAGGTFIGSLFGRGNMESNERAERARAMVRQVRRARGDELDNSAEMTASVRAPAYQSNYRN